MTRTRRRTALVLAALSLYVLPLVYAAPRSEAYGPAQCAPGRLPVRPGVQDGLPQGQLVALQPDAGPRGGGTLVTLIGAHLTPYTRVLFGTLGPDGCFTGLEATDVVVLSDTSVLAEAPPWPVAATVSAYAATPCGRLTNPLAYAYLD